MYGRGVISIIVILMIGLVLLTTVAYSQSYTIEYLYLNIETQSQSVSQIINITSNTQIIPVYQYCEDSSEVNITIALDPLSNLGISSLYLVLYNGTEMVPTLMEYSPKYAVVNIDCSLPVYSIELTLSNYPQLPMEALLIQGNALTYQLTSGAENITIPAVPGLNYAFSLVKVITILPGSFEINDYFTEPINQTLESITISSVTATAYVTTYITYLSTLQVISNGTTYIDVVPYYIIPITNNLNVITYSGTPLLMLNGAPWIKYTVNNCTEVNPSVVRLTPWTNYYAYSQQCTVNYTVLPITIEFTGLPTNTFCKNTFVLIPNGNTVVNLSDNITLNPLIDREFYIVLSSTKYVHVNLESIPTDYVQMPITLITRSNIQLVDENGIPVNVPLYLNLNGEFVLFNNNTCIYPGNYVMYALINNELVNLGNVSLSNNGVIVLPYFTDYQLNVTLTHQCPDLWLQLNVNYNGLTTQYTLNGNSIIVNLTNVLVGTRVNLQLIGNGTLLYTTSTLINNTGYGNAYLRPRIINFNALDLLNEEIPYAVLSVDGLSYVGPGDYCIPSNAAVGFVDYGGDTYVVNLTNSNITVRIWTISKLSINSILTIVILTLLILIIVTILRGFSGRGGSSNGSDDYLIIRLINPNNPT